MIEHIVFRFEFLGSLWEKWGQGQFWIWLVITILRSRIRYRKHIFTKLLYATCGNTHILIIMVLLYQMSVLCSHIKNLLIVFETNYHIYDRLRVFRFEVVTVWPWNWSQGQRSKVNLTFLDLYLYTIEPWDFLNELQAILSWKANQIGPCVNRKLLLYVLIQRTYISNHIFLESNYHRIPILEITHYLPYSAQNCIKKIYVWNQIIVSYHLTL